MPIPSKEQLLVAEVLSLQNLDNASRTAGTSKRAKQALERFTDGYMKDLTKVTALRTAVKVRGGFYNEEKPMTMREFNELIAEYGWRNFCAAITNQPNIGPTVLAAIEEALSKAGFNYT